MAAGLLGASASLQAAAPSYTSIEITAPAAGGSVTATGIDRHGDVVGSYTYPAGNSFATGAFVYYHRSGSVVPLQGIGASDATSASAINSARQIVGQQSGPAIGIEAMEWTSNGGETVLPANTLAMAAASDDRGDIAGNIENAHVSNLAAMWTGPAHQMTLLGVLWSDPNLPDYASSTANAINAKGHVAGFSDAGEGTDPNPARSFGQHAFLYRGGSMLDLGALALSRDGSDDSEAYGINDLDEVVGLSSTAIPAVNSLGQTCSNCGVASHAFLWRSGRMTDLGNLAGIPGWDSKADAINGAGEIVGWSDSKVSGSSTHRAFLYVGGRMLNLQFSVSGRNPNVRLTEAVGINCQGWIVANGFNTNTPDVTRAYLLIPSGPPRPCT